MQHVVARGLRGFLCAIQSDVRFRQIQDGGAAAILKNSSGDISAADRPIYTVFGSRMGFSGSTDFNGANSGLTKFNRYVEESHRVSHIGKTCRR